MGGGAGPSGGAYATGNMNMHSRVGGMMSGEGRWWEAFGTGGFEGEPSLMEGESRPDCYSFAGVYYHTVGQ